MINDGDTSARAIVSVDVSTYRVEWCNWEALPLISSANRPADVEGMRLTDLADDAPAADEMRDALYEAALTHLPVLLRVRSPVDGELAGFVAHAFPDKDDLVLLVADRPC